MSYSHEADKDKLIEELNQSFHIIKISKEYKKEGLHRKIYIDLKNR